MSVDTLIVIEGKGRVLDVPPALSPEGSVYGQALGYAVPVLDSMSADLGLPSISGYFVQFERLLDEITDECGEPESDEEEVQQERLLLSRAEYHSSEDGVAHVRRLIEELSGEGDAARARLSSSGAGRASLAETIWDLRVLEAVLADAASEKRGFFLWSL